MSTGVSLFRTLPQTSDGSVQKMCRWPVVWCHHYLVTAILSAIAILAYVYPGLTIGLQLDFQSVTAGQWWRLFSGHLTHYGSQHLFWDLLMFVVLGAACERQHSRLFGVSLVVMALGISAAVTFACKDVTGYRGLSGIDTGLFVWFIGDQIRHSLADRDRMLTGIWVTAGALLIGKLLFEFVTGEVLFVDADGFKPLIESHLVGAAFGALFAGLGIWSQERVRPEGNRKRTGQENRKGGTRTYGLRI